MGAVRVEILRRDSKHGSHPGAIAHSMPLQVATETSSTTATTAGSRIVVAPVPNNFREYIARCTIDEACYVAAGADPTAAAASAWLAVANTPIEIPVVAGDKLSFKDVA